MNERKSLRDISWQVPEEEYRADKALSYSILSRYNREGFQSIPNLFEKIETPSLTFGSMVDILLTTGNYDEGEKAFNEKYAVVTFPSLSDTLKAMANRLYDLTKAVSIKNLSDEQLLVVLNEFNYYKNLPEATRVNKLRADEINNYFKVLSVVEGKTIVTPDEANLAYQCRDAIRNSPVTGKYFADNNSLDGVERFYQLKFKGDYEGIPMRCMPDLLYVNYETKTIIPIDLKTSTYPEYEFYKSFVHWGYDIQARSYWYIIRQNMDKDEYFKNFSLEDYLFIDVSKTTLNPLIYKWVYSTAVGDIALGIKNVVVLKDWRDILCELYNYINTNATVPNYINPTEPNNLMHIINSQYE